MRLENRPPAARDGSVSADATPAAKSDAAVTATVASECPPPAALAPADVPAGYLAPVRVTLGRPVDGDTAHFDFSDSGDETIRFLFVNTEESHGEATTRFGVETAAVVARYLRSAREIVVAVREDRNRPGRPNYDPYGRWLGLVFLDGELLETRLVREGLSAYYTEFGCAPEPVHTALVHAEAEAHAAGAGIWAPGHPTDYRPVLQDWIGRRACRPNPFEGPYCP